MKKLLIITGTILLLCIIITSQTNTAEIKADPLITENISEQTSHVASQDNQPENSNENFYILKEYNDYVAVFHGNEEKPLYVSKTLVKDLPKADKLLLKCGIRANDKKALTRLVEDYCS